MYERKLLALDFPSAGKFNFNDTNDFRSLILWLEDQKIRHYKVEDRGKLRDLKSGQWDSTYRKYLDDIACPITSKKREEELEWLLSFAVRLEYGDNPKKYEGETSEALAQSPDNVPRVVSVNPLDNMDFQSPDFVNGVNSLAAALNVTQHPDHMITLKAVSKVVKSRLSPECLSNPNSAIIKGTPFPFQEADLGFDMGDYVLNDAAKILRLLYIHNLRGLQTQINEAIVAVQTVTANPKTDTKLGQVGR